MLRTGFMWQDFSLPTILDTYYLQVAFYGVPLVDRQPKYLELALCSRISRRLPAYLELTLYGRISRRAPA